jgi:hypothetical protein
LRSDERPEPEIQATPTPPETRLTPAAERQTQCLLARWALRMLLAQREQQSSLKPSRMKEGEHATER